MGSAPAIRQYRQTDPGPSQRRPGAHVRAIGGV